MDPTDPMVKETISLTAEKMTPKEEGKGGAGIDRTSILRSLARAETAQNRVRVEEAKMAMKDEKKTIQEIEEAAKKPLIKKILAYMERFPFLKEKIPKIGAKASLIELRETVALIREEMDGQMSLHQVHKYFDYGFMFTETTWKDGSALPQWVPAQLRFNLTNMTDLWRNGAFAQELEPLIMEIDCEYPWLGRQSLLVRTVDAMSSIMMKVHLYNTNPAARKVLNLEKTPPANVPEMEKL